MKIQSISSDFSINKFTLFILICFAIVLISSCKQGKISSPTDVGYDFFPYETGTWMHYDVDSTIWDDFTSQTYEYHSQLLEVFESKFTDSEGNDAFRIERYFRKSDADPWIIQDIWFANIKPASAEKVEENVRFVKLSFPVRSTLKWDGNAFNFMNEEYYSYKNLFQPMSVLQNHFDSTITVEHRNSFNLIEEDIRYEVYARHVGLIKKYSKTVRKNIAQPDIIVSGTLIEYKLREYGQNN